jgi:hypothetical protein
MVKPRGSAAGVQVPIVMFVRFVVGTDGDNAFRLDGVFTAAWMLDRAGELYDHESQWLDEVVDWFNEHLPCPPFRQQLRSGEWTRAAVCWFRDKAGEPLKRIWDIVAVLEDHGTRVRMITTAKPGKIVYADRYQMVAEPPHWI